jgi:GH15 family glucan-1,4-alpha-glucosidase
MPITGFVVSRDPMWLSTLDAMEQELVSDSLVYRYNPSASPDELAGSKGTFTICSFWYVDALARAGRLDKARYIFEKMLTYANHLGLYPRRSVRRGNISATFHKLSATCRSLAQPLRLTRRSAKPTAWSDYDCNCDSLPRGAVRHREPAFQRS